jgi:hypothetical protein
LKIAVEMLIGAHAVTGCETAIRAINPSIERFLRPECYQDLPGRYLPESLTDRNLLGIPRLRNRESESPGGQALGG